MTVDDLRLPALEPEGTTYSLRLSSPSGEEGRIELVLRNYMRHYDAY
jgi:hypothetical protein